VTDRLARLLLVTLEAARVNADLPVLEALRSWLDSWRGIELGDLLIIVVWVGLVLASVVAFIWRIYRRGVWGAIEIDPQLLQRAQRAWKRRSERDPRTPKAK